MEAFSVKHVPTKYSKEVEKQKNAENAHIHQ